MSVTTEEKPKVTRPRRTNRPATRTIPPALIYELWQGKPVYYRGYRDVVAGKKNHRRSHVMF